jgi:hypothetical protein
MKHIMGTTVAIIGLFIFCGVARGSDEQSVLEALRKGHNALRIEHKELYARHETLCLNHADTEAKYTENITALAGQLATLKTVLTEQAAQKHALETAINQQAAQIKALEQEKAKSENKEHYYARNERAWKSSLGLTSIMAVKTYTPKFFYTAGAKVASYMPAVLTKYSGLAISFCSPYVLPAIGVAAALWLLKNIGTDIHKNWTPDKEQFIKEKKVGENTKLGCKLSCQLLWHRFVKHTSWNVETIVAPAVVCVAALRYLRR